MKQAKLAAALLTLCLAAPSLTWAQKASNAKADAAAAAAKDEADGRKLRQRLGDVIDPVKLDNVAAKDAFSWWSKTTGVGLVIDWKAMEDEGIDPGRSINLDLRNMPAGKLLGLLMKETSPDVQLLYEITPWYIEVTTKARANRNLVTRFYEVSDLLHEPNPPRQAPKLDLTSALSASTGGGGGGSNTSIMSSTTSLTRGNGDTVQPAPQKIIDTITTTIEPEIWESRGGPATITFIRGFLVVKAPVYVHAQIGLPTQDRSPRPVVGTAGGDGRKATDGDKASGVGGVSAPANTGIGGVAR